MVKSFVAPLAVLALLAFLSVPAAAESEEPATQDAGPESPDPGPEPSQDPAPEDTPDGSGNATTGNGTADSGSAAVGGATGCQLVQSKVGEGGTSASQWIVFDPNGCYTELVKRVVGIPPVRFALSRL